MVYFGPSRGCETCKRRRKKCDEARPSCTRCINANRACGGYVEDRDRHIFRHFEQGADAPVPSWKPLARKCSLPIRKPLPGTNVMPEDILPKEVSEDEIEEYALRSFFYDYPVLSTNREVSRGYLDGLEGMLRHLGPKSDLARACKVVACAGLGIRLCRPGLIKKAEVLYQDLIGSLVRAIEDPAFATSAESLMTAMLLGLYEIIIANETHPGNHKAHARGVAAILQIENSPLDLFGAVYFIRPGHPVFSNGATQNCGIFSAAPHSKNGGPSLDDLLLAFGPIWRKANTILAIPCFDAGELYQLKKEAMALDEEVQMWQGTRCSAFNPRIIGQITKEQAGLVSEVGYWPGRVDAFFDLYVASVWNTSRIARLLIISLILKLSNLLNDKQDHTLKRRDALELAGDIIASIPYHLTDDLQTLLQNGCENEQVISPGKPVGGLLLMHPIYIASTLMIVPQEMREYLKECLSWIETYMGIGQASIFAKARQIDKQYFADGSLLVWAGMLV